MAMDLPVTGAMALERPSRLPPEIVRHIVSIVSADRNTLLACALVCQDWLSESRALLLRNIDIFSPQTLNSFTSNILRSERVRPWLTSTHHISVNFLDSDMKDNFILEISEHLSNLRTMGWQYFFPHCTNLNLRPDLFAALGRFARLYQLKLVFCTFPSFEDLTNAIVAFPSLSSLTMSQVTWIDSTDLESTSSVLAPPTLRPTLSQLSISASAHTQQPNDIFHWLSGTPTRYALRDLSLDFGKILAALEIMPGTSLTALTVRMKGLRQVFGDDARLAKLAQLLSRAGDLRLLRLHATFSHSFSWFDLARVLRLFTPVSSIRHLRLCYRSSSYVPSDVEMLDRSFEPLGPILEDSTFMSLESVEFASFADVEQDEALRGIYDEFSGWLRRKLPRLHERVAAELYVYNSRCAFGPAGFTDATPRAGLSPLGQYVVDVFSMHALPWALVSSRRNGYYRPPSSCCFSTPQSMSWARYVLQAWTEKPTNLKYPIPVNRA